MEPRWIWRQPVRPTTAACSRQSNWQPHWQVPLWLKADVSQHRARKRFGQNFLTDASIVRQIADRYQNTEQTIVEIGPGKGALTTALLDTGTAVIALELDRDLIPLLQRQFGDRSNLHLQQADALKFDWTALSSHSPLHVVGNLPYNIATPLIFNLLEHLPLITDMQFMLQWEVVLRLCAQPGSKHYGQLSVVVQNLCETTALFEVPSSAFSPAPKVTSGVVQLIPRSKPLIDTALHIEFNHLVKSAFAQRRKTLRNNLKGLLDSEQISACGIDPGQRAETLTIDVFKSLTEAFSRQ
jgi:16S rRNA (adenine1518-N6/adenine1519-N6)-dimethyltransferase